MFLTTSSEITGFTQIRHPQAEIIRPELQNPRLQLLTSSSLPIQTVRCILCNSLGIETVSNKETT